MPCRLFFPSFSFLIPFINAIQPFYGWQRNARKNITVTVSARVSVTRLGVSLVWRHRHFLFRKISKWRGLSANWDSAKWGITDIYPLRPPPRCPQWFGQAQLFDRPVRLPPKKRRWPPAGDDMWYASETVMFADACCSASCYHLSSAATVGAGFSTARQSSVNVNGRLVCGGRTGC